MMLFLLKSAVVLTVLFGFYKIFLQKESFFGVNRAYLIVGLVLTFVLPMVTLPELVKHQGIVESVVAGTKTTNSDLPSFVTDSEPSVPILREETEENSIYGHMPIPSNYRGTAYWIGLFYLFGVLILSLNFLTQLLGIFLKIKKSKDRLKDDDCIILNQTDDTEPCSFFNFIFIDPNKYDSKAYEQILEHEKVHVRKYHSLDLVLAEITIVMLWFNPFVWLYRKEVEKNNNKTEIKTGANNGYKP